MKRYLKRAGGHTADVGSVIGGVWHTAFSGRFDIELDLIDAFLQVLPYVFAPEPEHSVSRVYKRGINFFIPLDIPFDFGNPEVAVTLDDPLGFFPLMAVPELPVHEDSQPVFADHDIGPARKIFCMGTVADALCPERLAQ